MGHGQNRDKASARPRPKATALHRVSSEHPQKAMTPGHMVLPESGDLLVPHFWALNEADRGVSQSSSHCEEADSA